MKKKSTTARSYLLAKVLSILTCTFMSQELCAFVSPDQIYNKNRLDILLDTQFYKSTANFDSGGSKTDLLTSNYYQIIDVNPQLRWGATNDLGLRLGGNIGNAESSDPVSTRGNSTFNRLDVGADYLLFNFDSFQTIVDFEYSHPFEKVETNTDSVLNSNGASEVKPTLLLRMDLNGLYPFAYVGANVRSEGLSALLTYGGGAEFRFEEMGIGADVKGYTSVVDDKLTNQSVQRDAVTARVDGGSQKFYSVNPNLLTAELFLNFAMTRNWHLKLYAGYDVLGSNISQGYAAGATISFAFDEIFSSAKTDQQPRKTVIKAPTKQNQNNNSGFQEDTDDGVNQDYFKPVNPVKEEYVQPIEEEQKPVEPQQQQFQKGTGSFVDPATQKKLDQLGYTIKLKKKKKKK